MISWTKTLEMKIQAFRKKDDYLNKKIKAQEVKARFLNHHSGSSGTPIEIEIDKDTTIVFDAEFLKLACEKCIAIKSI